MYIVIKKTPCSVCCQVVEKTHMVPQDGKLIECDGYIREEVPLAEALKYEQNLQKIKETLIDK